MHNACEFCGNEYSPRPQVKNPRACRKRSCQAERQRGNEREWRELNRDRFGAEYFKEWRKRVHKVKTKFAIDLLESLKVGMKFRGHEEFDSALFGSFLGDFLDHLGMRSVNKLCNS